MKLALLGAGKMGQAIAYDLSKYSSFEKIIILDENKKAQQTLQQILPDDSYIFQHHSSNDQSFMKTLFSSVDIVISALPYFFNYPLTQLAIQTHTHFIDLGGNNSIVQQQRALHKEAIKAGVIIIPDCGLAPGLVSVITKDIVEHYDTVKQVRIRVGGIPLHPQPPWNYHLVFSAEGLLNEYTEDALILEKGKIKHKPSMTELETLQFPPPFGEMEAFLTSGGCSTLPYTYKDIIESLDYKTIRYPGHCHSMRSIMHLGLTDKQPLSIDQTEITPRDLLIILFNQHLTSTDTDAVLVKIWATGEQETISTYQEYSIIETGDDTTSMTAMMKTTGYPVSIIAQMIEQRLIVTSGVHSCEEIIPCQTFFDLLQERGINIQQSKKRLI